MRPTQNVTNMAKIHFLMKPPKDVYLAFSGGVDSVVLLHNLIRRGYSVELLFVDHLNSFAQEELLFCDRMALTYGLKYKVFKIPPFDKSTSLEAFWSTERNKIYQSMDKPVLVGHHLDDAVESYLMAACQGTNRLLDPVNRNVYRPMITNTKKAIIEYANKYHLTYLTDPTNLDPNFNLRNKVRLQLVGNVKACFPGIYTTVKRLTIQKHKSAIENKNAEFKIVFTVMPNSIDFNVVFKGDINKEICSILGNRIAVPENTVVNGAVDSIRKIDITNSLWACIRENKLNCKGIEWK